MLTSNTEQNYDTIVIMETTESVSMQEEVTMEVTAPSAVNPVVEVEYAFGVVLPAWGEFKVVKSANAWWMDTRKVALLFDGYKAGSTDEGACINANISLGQLRYFRENHPDFTQAKDACKSAGLAKFLNGLHSKWPEDLPTIRWYLSKMHPDFKTKAPVEPSPVVQQTVNVGVMPVVQNVDTTKIEELLTRAAERFLSEHRGA